MLRKLAFVATAAFPLCAQGWIDRSAPNGPAPRYGHAMCYDPTHGYTLMVGGGHTQQLFQETWSWDGSAWTNRGSVPFGYSFGYWNSGWGAMCTLVRHEATGTIILLARANVTGSETLQAHAWNGSTWTSLGNTGLSSSYGGVTTACYDAVRQETVVYSSWDNSRVAVWNGTSWSLRTALVTTYALDSGTGDTCAAWDGSAGRIVLTCANQVGNYVVPRVWEWTGLAWQLRLPSVLPSRMGTTVTDSLHQRIVMFDSDWSGLGALQPNHTWILQNGSFTRLVTPIEPTLRQQSAMAFDSARGVCVLFGGFQNSAMGDTWEFDLGPLASFSSYGAGCMGSRGVPSLAAQGTSLPRLGSNFTAHVSNLPWGGPAFLVLGLSNTNYSGTALPLDLGFLGAPTCNLRASIDDIQGLVNVLGAASWNWTIPPMPGATFYAQVLPLDPGQNALGITGSNACQGVIGL